MGAHTAPPSTSRWKRRILGLPVVAWLVIALAGVAVAALFALARTAPSTFDVQAEGNLAAGFTTDVDQLFANQTLEVGTPITSCINYEHGSATMTAPEEVRLYFTDYADAGLAQYVDMTVEIDSSPLATPGIDPTCADFGGGGLVSTTVDTVANFAAANTAYSSGIFAGDSYDWPAQEAEQWVVRITLELQEAAATNGLNGGESFDLGWTLESRETTP